MGSLTPAASRQLTLFVLLFVDSSWSFTVLEIMGLTFPGN